jgi:alanine dehydrogenase
LVENTEAVGWNGLEASFECLERLAPGRLAPGQPPLSVTVLGSGQVGKYAIDAATKYGHRDKARCWLAEGRPPIQVTVVGRALMQSEEEVRGLLVKTDVLVDATQRDDPSTPLIPNRWLGDLPVDAVICDLVVDPYVLTGLPRTVRSIEGIPKGNLDRYIFAVGDPAWSTTVPPSIPQLYRRPVVSCYSWPGIHPLACMERYGRQLAPLLTKLIERGGAQGLRPEGDENERALWRASLQPGEWKRLGRPGSDADSEATAMGA